MTEEGEEGVREEERKSEGERKRDEENKRAAERAGTLFVALLKIHKALCLLTKDTRLAPVAPQSRTPQHGGSRHLRASSTPRERRALSRKIKLLVALFSTRAVPFCHSPRSRESRGANFFATFKPKLRTTHLFSPGIFARLGEALHLIFNKK